MRLWSLNPCYLDSKGLVACWRESLLCQNVLFGRTKGYKNHPQVKRFEIPYMLHYIGWYLVEIYEEGYRRNYKFDKEKIYFADYTGLEYLTVTKGQLGYEFNHLQAKLFNRDKIKCALNFNSINVEVEFMNKDNRVYLTYTNKPFPYDLLKPHPMFKVIDGDIEEWEKVK